MSGIIVCSGKPNSVFGYAALFVPQRPDGSTLLARMAGNQTATRATPIKIAGTTQNQGSHAFPLYWKPAINRVNSKAAGEADHGPPAPTSALE